MKQLTLPISLEEATKVILKKLPSRRMKDVVEKRYGLKGGKKKTLEAIGREYKITRERVRQIEADALKNLSRAEHLEELRPLFQVLETYFREHGQVLAEYHFFSALPSARISPHALLLLTINKSFTELPETETFYTRWTVEPKISSLAEKIVENSVKKLAEVGHSISSEELHGIVAKYSEELFGEELPQDARESYLASSKEIRANPYGEYGLSSWPTISPRGVKDKAYLVLEKSGKPMHFREVAQAINAMTGWPVRRSPARPAGGLGEGGNRRKAHPQTVHNELIKDRRFVLVGRGLYALKEWGFEPGTVRDILVSVLKKAGRPLSKEKLVSLVLEKRFVKPPTILLNLQDKSLFKRADDGYALA